VHTGFISKIVGDVGMTRNAHFELGLIRQRVVATAAVIFYVRMALDDRSRHD